jgi:hypothetical protein
VATVAGLQWIDNPEVSSLDEVPPGTLLLIADTLATEHEFITNRLILSLDCVLQVAGGRSAARAAVHRLSNTIREDRSLSGHVRDVVITNSRASAVHPDPDMGVADLLIQIRYEGLGA